MDKEVVKLIINKERVPQELFSQFIVDFLTFKNKSCNSEQLQGLLLAIRHGFIDIYHTMEQLALNDFNWSIIRVFDKNGILIRTDIYE